MDPEKKNTADAFDRTGKASKGHPITWCMIKVQNPVHNSCPYRDVDWFIKFSLDPLTSEIPEPVSFQSSLSK